MTIAQWIEKHAWGRWTRAKIDFLGRQAWTIDIDENCPFRNELFTLNDYYVEACLSNVVWLLAK